MADATTAHLAEFIVHTKTEDLPPEVAANGVRAFLNWVGCTLGGATHPAARTAFDAAVEFAGAPTATLFGRGKHLDAINTAYINCIASAAHAYDDTHLSTVIHPTGPVASAAFALAERKGALSGNDLLGAIVIGIETSCQLGHALLIPPAKGQLGWYMTGVAGAIGAAAASARILDLDEQQTRWALGIAGNQASGYRQTHGSMCTSFVPGHAARSGMHAAFLAHQGFTASDDALEGNNGFADVFAFDANLGSISERLGNIWEIHSNA
ncbi:MAG: MmgE/PrpD family protein, partial [Gammaproteobacteria bacterium]|nr:MmgE/PrpD family protein [Gammaproteobacteria bacterium]